jgi:transposase-like protein
VAHRRYEALRAYFLEGATAAEAAGRFGYTTSTVQAMVRDFRAGDTDLFVDRRPGPRTAPAKQAARDQVVRPCGPGAVGGRHRRRAGRHRHAAEPHRGVGAAARRRVRTARATPPGHAPGGTIPRGPDRSDWPEQPVSFEADYVGALLLLPGLVELDLPGAVGHAKMPGTRQIPALNSVLSLLALKAIGRRRVSHVDDVATDPALAAFAGMSSLPKATALGSYSYKLDRTHDAAAARSARPTDARDRSDRRS